MTINTDPNSMKIPSKFEAFEQAYNKEVGDNKADYANVSLTPGETTLKSNRWSSVLNPYLSSVTSMLENVNTRATEIINTATNNKAEAEKKKNEAVVEQVSTEAKKATAAKTADEARNAASKAEVSAKELTNNAGADIKSKVTQAVEAAQKAADAKAAAEKGVGTAADTKAAEDAKAWTLMGILTFPFTFTFSVLQGIWNSMTDLISSLNPFGSETPDAADTTDLKNETPENSIESVD